jgi:CheY-like chemotaxis protein
MQEQQEFSLVLLDYCQMPIIDGFTATRAIRALQNDKALLSIMALTSNTVQEDREPALMPA